MLHCYDYLRTTAPVALKADGYRFTSGFVRLQVASARPKRQSGKGEVWKSFITFYHCSQSLYRHIIMYSKPSYCSTSPGPYISEPPGSLVEPVEEPSSNR